jgi:hypothetical protein
VDATLGKESAGARKSRGKLGRGLGSKDEGKALPRIDLSERKRGWNTWRDGGKGEKRVGVSRWEIASKCEGEVR